MVYMRPGGKGYQVVRDTAGHIDVIADTNDFNTAWCVWVTNVK